jgi:hypothetical protein
MFRWVSLPRWRVPALLLLFTLFFYWKILFTNRVMFPGDTVDFFYPYLSFVHEELRHFRLPLWDPYVMSGFPIIGDMEAQIFYPINWLFVLVNPFSPLPYKLVEMQIILHFFLAGLFMFYLAKEFTGETLSALLGGVLFMSSGAMVAHTQHLASNDAMAWYPAIFLLARRGLLEGKWFYIVSAGMLFGIQILAGHWQHSVYLGVLLFLYFAYEACLGRQRASLWPRWIYYLALVGGVGSALAMVQILPSHELGYSSTRTHITYEYMTSTWNVPNYLWTLFLPNFFGGVNGAPQQQPFDFSFNYVFLTVPGCLLALLGLLERARRRDFFWLGAVLFFTLLSLGYMAKVVWQIPILNLFRPMGAYFDLTNFALCLMAAVGAQSLFSKTLSQRLRKLLLVGLISLLVCLTAAGFIFRLDERIYSWHLMPASLAVFSALVGARFRNYLSPRAAQIALLGAIVLELCHFSMNQRFNWTIQDPRRYVSYDYALGYKRPLDFLRSDAGRDFRVAAFAGFPWSGNGWNVWQIPGIFGWNPLALRSYDHYLRGFIRSQGYYVTMPDGSTDHNLDSPMLDLLGTKYLVLSDDGLAQELKQSGKFEFVHQEGRLKIYRNRNDFSRLWFYPKAYLLPDEAQVIAAMSSSWFDPGRILLFEKKDLAGEATKLVEEIPTITLRPEQAEAVPNGYAVADPHCAEGLAMFVDWAHQGGSIRYEVSGPPQPGEYLLLMRYTAHDQPGLSMEIAVENGSRTQVQGPVSLPATSGWPCFKTRTAELGRFEVGPGMNRITVRSLAESAVNVYSLWLVRLPETPAPESRDFSFSDFSVSANRIAFQAQLSQDGYVLLNEIYYPGWEATMDGAPLEVLPADGIFRALAVPAGSHQIEMRFRPRHLAAGAAVSLLTLAFLMTYFTLHRRRRRAEKAKLPAHPLPAAAEG